MRLLDFLGLLSSLSLNLFPAPLPWWWVVQYTCTHTHCTIKLTLYTEVILKYNLTRISIVQVKNFHWVRETLPASSIPCSCATFDLSRVASAPATERALLEDSASCWRERMAWLGADSFSCSSSLSLHTCRGRRTIEERF